MDAKYITTASGEPIHSWLTIYTIRLLFISYERCSQSKDRDIIFHLSKKKIYAEEVTFGLKIFSTGKSLIKPGSKNGLIKLCFNLITRHDSFCSQTASREDHY